MRRSCPGISKKPFKAARYFDIGAGNCTAERSLPPLFV
jgi:hypothetical protein